MKNHLMSRVASNLDCCLVAFMAALVSACAGAPGENSIENTSPDKVLEIDGGKRSANASDESTRLHFRLSEELSFGDNDAPFAGIVWSQGSDAIVACLESEDPNCQPWGYVGGEVGEAWMVDDVSEVLMPITEAPPEGALYRGATSTFAIGALFLFIDRNGNQKMDTVAKGSNITDSDDAVIASSLTPSANSFEQFYLAYRGGDDSPMAWALGCYDEMPMGYSVFRRDDAGYCDILPLGDGVDVGQNSSTASSICETPYSELPVAPGSELPESGAGQCQGNTWWSYIPNTAVDCVEVIDVSLAGCSDVSSQMACASSYWDLRDTPPSWWPCGGTVVSDTPIITLSDSAVDTTSDLDLLMTLIFSGGEDGESYDPATLTVGLTSDTNDYNRLGFSFELSGTSLTLNDINGDGRFGPGDSFLVWEGAADDFDAQSYGRFNVEIRSAEDSVYFGFDTGSRINSFKPVEDYAYPYFDVELSLGLYTGPFTEETRELMYFYSVDSGESPIEQLHLSTGYGGCNAIRSVGPDDRIHVDNDGDGLVSVGDRIDIFEPNEEPLPVGDANATLLDSDAWYCVAAGLLRDWDYEALVTESFNGDNVDFPTLGQEINP